MLRFFIPVVTISVPMQKAIADPWMAIAKKSFHTPESDSSRPTAIPSKRLCMESAKMTRADRRWVINVVFSFAFFAAGLGTEGGRAGHGNGILVSLCA